MIVINQALQVTLSPNSGTLDRRLVNTVEMFQSARPKEGNGVSGLMVEVDLLLDLEVDLILDLGREKDCAANGSLINC